MQSPRTYILTLFIITGLLFACPEGEASGNGAELADYEFNGGVLVHTNGLGVDFALYNRITADRQHLFNFNIRYIKHPKEVRLINQLFSQARPFAFGKKHSFFTVGVNYGQSHALSRTYEYRDVLIKFNYGGGLSLGLLKPVYLEVIDFESGDGQQRLVTEQYDPDRHAREDIYGGASFTRGLAELKPVIGAGIKSGIAFQWNSQESMYRLLEAGFKIDAFPSEIPIFAFTDNNQIYFNLYLQYSFGNRW